MRRRRYSDRAKYENDGFFPPLNRRGDVQGLPIFGNRATGNIDTPTVQQFNDAFVRERAVGGFAVD
jgi:hypothetical protein